jgi:hypothetical protein
MGMNESIKKQWTDALRSGEYVQGRGQLGYPVKNIDGTESGQFCCLGVLCEIAVKAGIVQRRAICDVSFLKDESYQYGSAHGDEDDTVLPFAVQEWAGLSSSDPNVADALALPGDDRTVALSFLNDARGLSFNEIADAIDASL